MVERRRSVDELADQLDKRAARARAANTTESATERYLDAVLPQHGFHCLHDCVWPGSRGVNVDHVVIGPTGVWVVDDKLLTGAVTADDRGELGIGRHPMAPEVTKARAQADCVSSALGGAPTTTILSIRSSTLPGGSLERGGVVLATALTSVAEVIVRGAPRLLPDEVTRLALSASGALRPRRSAAPGLGPPPARAAGPSPLVAPAVPDVIPSWMVAPAPTTPRPRPVQRRRQPRSVLRTLELVVLVGFVVAAIAAAYGAVREAIDQRTPSTTAVGEMAVAFECRHPGAGWTEVVRWSGLGAVDQVTWTTNPGGLNVTTLPYGTTATRDGIAASEHSFVTVHPAERSQAAIAPATSC